jgi:hypothetical protein
MTRKRFYGNELIHVQTVWELMDVTKCVQFLRTNRSARYAQTANFEGEIVAMFRSGTVVNTETWCAYLRRLAPGASTQSQNSPRSFPLGLERILSCADFLRTR